MPEKTASSTGEQCPEVEELLDRNYAVQFNQLGRWQTACVLSSHVSAVRELEFCRKRFEGFLWRLVDRKRVIVTRDAVLPE